MGYSRKRAIELNAADAKRVIKSSLPFLLTKMTDAQITQVQRVMDAAVVNPAIQEEYRDLYRRSIVAQSGGMVIQDPNKARRADRKFESQIPWSEADKYIKLNFESLLAPNALTPTTDNPDEAAYLKTVRDTLAKSGVWLRVYQPHFRDPKVPSNHITDARKWEVYLSFGRNGDKIQTKNGQITREDLLKISSIGAGYHWSVYEGPVLKTLEREIKRLQREIEAGEEQHHIIDGLRVEVATRVSERLGGADFPSQSIWNYPREFITKAWNMKLAGNFTGCRVYLVAAALLTRSSARMLGRYIDSMSTGSERAVRVLKVLDTAGDVAEVGLLVTGVGLGTIRGVAKTSARSSAGAIRGTSSGRAKAATGSVDDRGRRFLAEHVKENPEFADHLTQKVLTVPGPKGTVSRGVPRGQGAGTGFHEW